MRFFLKDRSVWILVVTAVLTVSAPARAIDLESVESLIRQGIELRRDGHDERALPLFQKAYGMARAPRTAGQLGLCEMAVGYWLNAESHLVEALSSPDNPWVNKNLTVLSAALATARKSISDVVVDGGPAGATVLVNGQLVGKLPLSTPVRLGKGPADIEVRFSGYATASRSLQVAGGAQEHVTIVLAQLPAIVPPPPVSAVTDQPVPPEVESSGPATQESARTRPRRVAAWTTAVAAGLSLGLGIVETFVWVSKHDQFQSHRSAPPASAKDCGESEMNYGGPGCQGLRDDFVRARTLTLVGYGLGAVLGVTSAILFVTSADDRPKTDTALRCAPDFAGRGVGCGFSF